MLKIACRTLIAGIGDSGIASSLIEELSTSSSVLLSALLSVLLSALLVVLLSALLSAVLLYRDLIPPP